MAEFMREAINTFKSQQGLPVASCCNTMVRTRIRTMVLEYTNGTTGMVPVVGTYVRTLVWQYVYTYTYLVPWYHTIGS
jgi:hypothetical protein